MAEAVERQVQPVYEWGLDPIHWAHAKLFVCDILGLKESTVISGTVHFSSQFYLELKTITRQNDSRWLFASIMLTKFNTA